MISTTIILKTLDEAIEKCQHREGYLTPKQRGAVKPTRAEQEFIDQFKIEDYHEGDLEMFEDHSREQNDFQYEDKNGGFTDDEITAVETWGDEGYEDINGKIYNTDDYQESIENGWVTDEDIDEWIENIDSAIEKSPNIPVNTVLFREGHWVKGIMKGDIIEQKGYASTSYDEEEATGWGGSNRYNIKYYVPKDTKGLWLNAPFANLDEAEYLISRNIRFYVLDVNDDRKTASIVVLPK